MLTRNYILIIATILSTSLPACKKMVEVPEPVDTITSLATFSTESQAISAMMGIYDHMIINNGGSGYANGETTVYAGMSADELYCFDPSGTSESAQFQLNKLVATNNLVQDVFGRRFILTFIAVMQSLKAYRLHPHCPRALKDQLTGEAKFVRAFSYLILVNLFGEVPLVTTTAFAENAQKKRSSVAEVYKQIISDLTAAASLLPDDYTVSNGKRVRPNKAAATALIARAYLYLGDWAKVEQYATQVIDNPVYHLLADLGEVFKRGSEEAIWQLQVNGDVWPYTPLEARRLIAYDTNNPPSFLSDTKSSFCF